MTKPPHLDLDERSERLLLVFADSWLSSYVPVRFGGSVHDLIDEGLVTRDSNADLLVLPTALGLRYSRAWLDLDGRLQGMRAKLLNRIANSPVDTAEAEHASFGFAYRWLLRSGQIASYRPTQGEPWGRRYGLPQSEGAEPRTEGRQWSRFLIGPDVKYTPEVEPLLAAGLVYRATWEHGGPVRLTARGQQRALWQRPGGQFLETLLPAWRAATPTGAVDDFLGRQLGGVVVMVEGWIVRDARRSSQTAIPDPDLRRALALAADDDSDELDRFARSVLSDYWAMEALRDRAGVAHPDGERLVMDALLVARARRDSIQALKGHAPRRWRPPVYQRAGRELIAQHEAGPTLNWRTTTHNGRTAYTAKWDDGIFKAIVTKPGIFALFFLGEPIPGREGYGGLEAYGCGSLEEVKLEARRLAAAGLPFEIVWRGALRKCPPAPGAS